MVYRLRSIENQLMVPAASTTMFPVSDLRPHCYSLLRHLMVDYNVVAKVE